MSTEAKGEGWVARLIELSARNAWLTVLFAFALAGFGYRAWTTTPLDAIPDLSDVQVIVFTEWEGRSPDLIEDQITYPITTALLAAPKVSSVRGQSMFGMSFVYVIFEDGTDLYWARSRVLEYLSRVTAKLPEEATPVLGPDASGVGWVFQYALVSDDGRHDLSELRALQDWNLRYALESLPGVAEVASVGGFVREYQIDVDPAKLLSFRVSIGTVIGAVQGSNRDVGGGTLEVAGHELMVRGRGYVRGVDDLEGVVLATTPVGTPVLLRDVAEVRLGPAPRRGVAELDGLGETVGAIVIMRHGENALRVIEAVKQRIEEIKAGLPSGIRLQVTYDRSELILQSIETLKTTLLHEMIVVSLVIFLFLLHVRSALVPILTLPVAVLLSFLPMSAQGLTANIMSLGGIAVAIGAMVDGSIILVENVHQRLHQWASEGSEGDRTTVIIRAMQEVGPTVFFSLLVITVAFMPVFTLQGTEGRLFAPLAYTKTYSMGFGAILAVTLTPALAAIFVRGAIRAESDNPINRWLTAAYVPLVRVVVRHPGYVVLSAITIVGATVPFFLKLESEFMPPLHEGAILYMPTAPPGISMTEATRVLQKMDEELRSFPEVVSVFGKMGRAETPTDPAPLGMAEITVILRPRDEWRPGLTYEALIEEMDQKLQYPGMPNLWWMPIQTRTEMLSTGIRSPLGIQIFGPDLRSIERAALELERELAQVPGVRSAFAERSTGGFYLDVRPRPVEAARHGLLTKDINEVVMSAIGGLSIGQTVEGRARYPIRVAYPRELRDDPDQLGRILVATPSGAQVPLSQVAELRSVLGPPMVRSEDAQLVGYVFVDSDRPIVELVEDAKRHVSSTVSLPAGVRLGWTGQFEYFERAKARFLVVAPLAFALIVLLLFLNTRSWTETLLVVGLLPTALVGAVWILYLFDYRLSVAVWVGAIALAGLDAETSVVMLLYLRIAHAKAVAAGKMSNWFQLEEAIVEGAAKRLRPKLMTVATTMIGLVPILWSQGEGSDVMRRIAAPMVGGLLSSFLLELLVYPAVFALWKGKDLSR